MIRVSGQFLFKGKNGRCLLNEVWFVKKGDYFWETGPFEGLFSGRFAYGVICPNRAFLCIRP